MNDFFWEGNGSAKSRTHGHNNSLVSLCVPLSTPESDNPVA
jgi:hypothetical protein